MSIRVGVIGGGQLARMMIPPAVHLGLDLRVLAETEGMSAALAATMIGDGRATQPVLDFAATVDVVTFDHEHVPLAVMQAMVDAGVRVHPHPQALRVAQDKRVMRQELDRLGVPVPTWWLAATEADLAALLATNPTLVVKRARGGYDGNGVRLVTAVSDVADWFAERSSEAHGDELLVEERVAFRRELSQLIARRPNGEWELWPLVETVQRDGICAEVIAPAPNTPETVARAAADIAVRVAEGLDVTGVLAVELFECADGSLLVNELAMRPHNSGHWTIEGSATSQFEQHLRAVCDLPLGATGLRAPAVAMVNVLGGPVGQLMQDRYPVALAAHPEAKVHSYAKTSRPGRKVGHVTVLAETAAAALETARNTERLLRHD